MLADYLLNIQSGLLLTEFEPPTLFNTMRYDSTRFNSFSDLDLISKSIAILHRVHDMVELVIRAANILSVDELEVFRLANQFWHRHTADARQAFNEYLEKKIVPPWVLHFARSVVQAYKRGSLEPALFGVYPCFEAIPLIWSLACNTPRALPLNERSGLLIA